MAKYMSKGGEVPCCNINNGLHVEVDGSRCRLIQRGNGRVEISLITYAKPNKKGRHEWSLLGEAGCTQSELDTLTREERVAYVRKRIEELLYTEK